MGPLSQGELSGVQCGGDGQEPHDCPQACPTEGVIFSRPVPHWFGGSPGLCPIEVARHLPVGVPVVRGVFFSRPVPH